MLAKRAALLLFPLMQRIKADWTATITSVLTVSNGFTPVVDFTTTPSSGASTPLSTPASTPLNSFDSKHSYRERFTTVVTVSDGMIPVIHYSPILSTQRSTPLVPSKSSRASNLSSQSRSNVAVSASSSTASSYKLSSTSGKKPSSTPLAPSSSRLNPSSKSSSASSGSNSSLPPPISSNSDTHASSAGSPTSRSSISSTPLPGSSAGSSGSSLGAAGSSSPAAPSLSSGKSQVSPRPTSPPGSSSDWRSSSSQGPLPQLSSADLLSAPDLYSLTPSGSSSAVESAIIEFGATGSPTSQPWGTLTALPSSTITGTAANSDATDIAIFLRGFYNNIGQLKTDPETYKKNLEDVEKESEDYLSKVNYISSKSPCSGSLRKRSLFGAIGDLASSAANVAAGAADAAKSIVEDALSCIEPIADSMIKTIPDDVSEVTDDIENTIKKGSEYLNEISDIVTTLENKIKDDDDDNSSSESDSSTSSSSSSCTSSTTFSDCTTTTILIPTYSTGADGSTSPSTSTTTTATCSTATACNASPTSMATTTTEAGSCKVRRTTRLVPSYSNIASSIPYIPQTSSAGSNSSASPGSGGSTTPTASLTSPLSSAGISTVSSTPSSSLPGISLSSNVASSSGAVSSSEAISSSKVPSSSAMSSAPKSTSTPQTTSALPTASSYMCYNQGGPEVSTPYCGCSTVTEGQTYWATASLISGACWEYTSFPSTITLTPSFTPTTPTATPVPFITTETDGEILSYPSQIVTNLATEGAGTPVTLQTPSPSQTSGNDKGSGECHSIDDACDRAYEQYVDDTIYSSYTSYTANIENGIIVDATFGKAGCAAMFTCDNDDYGFGMTGRQIKAAVDYMKENDSVSKCGSTYLSNSCHITLNYCSSCKAT